ncbi:hypothetical protein LguiB_013471 [Lonicera macranthoides]
MRLFGVDISTSASASASSSAAAELSLLVGDSTMSKSSASASASSSTAVDPSLLVGGSTMSRSSASASASAYSSAAADPSLLVGEYEVFLSFCGQDTRYGFTDFLYTSLNDVGIRTFRDSESLHVGEEIGPELLKAITDSKISIPIFSKNYASKKWCLLELAHMVECLKNRGQMIFPIFYDVDPDDVQHQRGSYEEAFRQHRKRCYDKKVIQEWKNSLKKVGQLKALELKKETGGHEGELVKVIKNKVLEFLKQNNKHEDLDLVGMPSRIKKMEELLNIHSDVGDDDILGMHDQLRDLGRHIACEGKLDEWWKWSRLWECDKAFEVYKTGQGTEKVKALCLQPSFSLQGTEKVTTFRYFKNVYNLCHLEGEKFLRLPNLRYLTLDPRDTLYGDFEHCLPNLRWLKWSCRMLEFTATNLHLRNLVILDLSFSYITEQSNLWSQIQMSKKLKVLFLHHCNHLRRVHFLSAFSNLERLSVNNCYKLCSLDGVEELESLRYLNASSCHLLKILPNLNRLTKLKKLQVNKSGPRLATPITDIPGLDKLESLELLSLRNCDYLKGLPDLSNLKSLKKIDVSGTMLTEIRGLGGLKSLEVLDMSRCKYIERVFGLIDLKRLKILKIRSCVRLIEIHGLERLESLEFLDVGCCNFIEIPDLSKLKSLKALYANRCEKLAKIGGLEELISLEYLDIGGCKLIENLPDFSNLRKLKVIVAAGCES